MPIDTKMFKSFRKLDFWIAVCFTLNYIVGSGFLTLPFAFYEAGYILGLFSLLILVGLAIISMIFLLEVGERAKSLKKRTSLGGSVTSAFDYHAIPVNIELMTVHVTADNLPKPYHDAEAAEPEGLGHQLLFPGHVFEIPELCELFLGISGKNIYLAFITVYLYGVLWAYCSVFASAFATHAPLYSSYSVNFGLYLAAFGFIVVPMSLLELSEQVVVQVFLTLFRVVMLTVMVSTVTSAYYSGQQEFGSQSHDYSASTSEHIDKLPQLLSIAAYAFLVHHSIPALAQQVKDKRSLVTMFGFALTFCCFAYCLVGAVLSLYFGDSIQPSSNLCWEHYVGILNKDGSRPVYAQLVSHFVVLFPALDVASAFPLNAYTLGNSLMSGLRGTHDVQRDEVSRWEVSKYRLIAAVPPFFLAALSLPLNEITKYTGLAAFAIMFVFPSLLAYYSTKKLEEVGIPVSTIHSGWCSSVWVQGCVGMSGLLLLLVSTSWVLVEPEHKS